jgi:ubiquinone/menaquinone biosynthesis C-methylase UbiE
MRPEDRNALVRLYEDRFDAMGEDVKTLGWKNREEQNLRFKMLCEVGDLRGASVCDVGCGFADLLDYLRSTVGEVQYTGIDIAPSLLDRARQKYPEARFYCLNLADDPFDIEHDYFLLSGALSYKVSDNMALTERMLDRMFRLCRKGVAVNFLSTYVNYQNERNYHYSPEQMFQLAKRLTRWVRLRHDYPLWEFTLYLFKGAQ